MQRDRVAAFDLRSSSASFYRLDDLLRGVIEIVGGGDVEIGFRDDLFAELHVGTFESHHQGDAQAHLLHRCHDAFSDDVAFHDPTENVDQNAAHFGIGGNDLEGGRNFLLAGAAPDVEEIRRRFAIKLDDVHGRHGQPRAVDHAADRAIERDVIEVVFGSLDLLLVFFREIAQRHDVRMTVKRVVVEPDLGIEADKLVASGDNQRIDLEQAHVLGNERGVELSNEPFRLLGEIAIERERLRDPASMVRHNSGRWIDGKRHDLFGTRAGDLLDVDAPRGGYHEGNARAFAVDERREIKLPLDGGTLLDVEAADLFAVRARLM